MFRYAKSICRTLSAVVLLAQLLAAHAVSGTEPVADGRKLLDQTIATEGSGDDALPHAVDRNLNMLDEGDFPCSLVATRSGEVIFVATGSAAFDQAAANPTAYRQAMVNALKKSTAQAKVYLAGGLTGVRSELHESYADEVQVQTDNHADRVNIQAVAKEVLKQSVEALLKQARVCKIETKSGLVRVSVCTSTRPKLASAGNGVQSSTDLVAAVEQVVRDAQANLLPPTGVRLIKVADREAAVVGYGTAVVAHHDQPAVQSQLMQSARKIATARARASVVGFLSGDAIQWRLDVEQSHDELNLGSGEAKTGDQPSEAMEAKQSLLSSLSSSERISIVSQGVLPAGVVVKAWYNADLGTYHALAIFQKELSTRAAMGEEEAGNPFRTGPSTDTIDRPLWPSGAEVDWE